MITANPRDNLNKGAQDWYIPVRYSNLWDNLSVYDPGFISDLYYADIYDAEGNFCSWDSNGDGVYGSWSNPPYDAGLEPRPLREEENDIIDFYPDICLGRLACRNIGEVRICTKKIINYEKTEADPSWFKRVVAIGGDPYDDTGTDYLEGELVCNKAVSFLSDFEKVKLYASNKNINPYYTPLKPNILREISAGCGFLLFDGHGTPGSWNTFWPHDFRRLIFRGGIKIWDFPRLTNNNKLPVCVIGGCHCSQFNVSLLTTITDWDNSHYMWSQGRPIPECFGWWLTRKIGGGAIATIGSTGLGYEDGGEKGDLDGDGINEPDCVEALGGYLERQFFKAYAEENLDILGKTWATAITQFLDTFPGMDNQSAAKTVEQWALLGDPSLKIGGYSSYTDLEDTVHSLEKKPRRE
jgi:hypothetical protein